MSLILPADIVVGEIIGAGSLGVVKRGVLKKTSEDIVLKSLSFSVWADPLIRAELFIKEVKALSKLRHAR